MSLPLRILSFFVTIFAGLYTLLYSVLVLVLVFTGMARSVDFFIFYWSRVMNFLTRTEVTFSGVENIPEGPCLFIFNHLSLFDIPIILSVVRKRIRFGAKKELFYIPFFGQAMSLIGILKIDRGDRSDAIKTLEKASRRIHNGESFILAAEGTRQKQDKIGDFKSGPFILAIQSQCLIVPIVISGAYDVLPKSELFFRLERKHTVRLQILPPISTKGLQVADRQVFKSKVREIMLKAFQSS